MILDKDDVREVEKLNTCKDELLNFKRAMYTKKTRNERDSAAALL
jgi:hypothetical protein